MNGNGTRALNSIAANTIMLAGHALGGGLAGGIIGAIRAEEGEKWQGFTKGALTGAVGGLAIGTLFNLPMFINKEGVIK